MVLVSFDLQIKSSSTCLLIGFLARIGIAAESRKLVVVVMAAGGGGAGERSLEETPTWAVAIVCAVFVIISFLMELGIHSLGKVSPLCF